MKKKRGRPPAVKKLSDNGETGIICLDSRVTIDGGVWLPTDPPRPVGVLLKEAETISLLRLDVTSDKPEKSLAYYRERHGLPVVDVDGERMYKRSDLLALVDRL